MKKRSGLFISFEGPDGSGKSSVLKAIEQKIKTEFKNVDLMLVREPGGTKFGEIIRDAILSPKNQMLPITEALLFAASRAELFQGPALDHLKNNGLLISDRYVDSSIAYQGVARKIGANTITEINAFATKNLTPNLTFFLMIQPEKAILRINQNRKNQKDRLDTEDLSFHKRVYRAYKQIIKDNPKRAVWIDAYQDLDVVIADVWNKLSKVIKKHYIK